MRALLLLRSGSAVLIATLCLAIVGGQVTATTVTAPCSGTCGHLTTYDLEAGPQGVTCNYQRAADVYGDHPLQTINVRPPKMYGVYSSSDQVSWRFRIQKRSHGIEDPHVSTQIVYTSGWQTAMASSSSPAYIGSGFTRRSWTATGYDDLDAFRVYVDLRWWNLSSISGTEHYWYNWYLEKRGTHTLVLHNQCYPYYG